jgi:hypothetical protein
MLAEKQSRIQTRLEIILVVVGLSGGLIALVQFLPSKILGDGAARFQAITNLLELGELSKMRYSIVGPAFSSPLWFLGKLYQTSEWWCERYNLIVFAIGLLIIYLLLKDRVDRGLIRKFFLILIVASMFPNNLANYYGEVFTAMLVGVGILAMVIKHRLGGWIAVVLGVVNTPASILGLGFMVLNWIGKNKRLRYVLAVVAAAGLIAAEAWIMRGSPLNTGYQSDAGSRTLMPYSGEPGFSYPIFFGLLSILFSFGKGLFFFAPGLLLPVRNKLLKLQQGIKLDLYAVYTLWISFLVGLVLVYSHWWAWYGGWFWGPRFLLFASIPASFALAVCLQYRDNSLKANLLTLLILALSVWVGIDGAVFSQKNLSECLTRNFSYEFLCHYVPEFSVLWRPFVVTAQLDMKEIAYVVYSVIVFVYLSFPLFAAIVKQMIVKTENFKRLYLDLKSWHF